MVVGLLMCWATQTQLSTKVGWKLGSLAIHLSHLRAKSGHDRGIRDATAAAVVRNGPIEIITEMGAIRPCQSANSGELAAIWLIARRPSPS
jgi:hypothetical protein